MKHGDFSALAKEYIHRPGYSLPVLKMLAKHAGSGAIPSFAVADVGAGTGKLTENLLQLGLKVIAAVEPNDAMRNEGEHGEITSTVAWKKGTAERTGLDSESIHWLLMGSSFHWAKRSEALAEFHRVLKPGGYFTALWNPRDVERNPLHAKIEARIKEIVPDLTRVSSGSAAFTQTLFDDLIENGHFEECLFVEGRHDVIMTPERYLGAWRSVNDIQVQAGPERFEKILLAIADEIKDLNEIAVPYKTRAWTVRVRK